ncbi:MAG: radical SAM protein [Desulfosalsimonadaceae bacterium]
MAGSPHRKTYGPAYLQFYPTLRCNMACTFCFNRGLAGAADTDPDDFRKIVAIAADQGIGHIDFLGGEPTLHPDIESMIGMIASAGQMTTMSSNGTRPEILEILSRRFPETSLRIGISLNTGSNAGSIDKRLRDYIETYRPIVKTLFSNEKKSRGKYLFAGLDTDGIDLRLIYRDAVQETDLGECGSFSEFYNHLKQIQSDLPNLKGVYCQGFLPDRDDPVTDGVRCPAGTTKLAVMPDGTVYPCYLLFRYSRFRLGNLLTDDFLSIWEHPVLDFFRYFDKNRCPETDCALFDRCHGGCPAQGYMFTGDLDGPDPRCSGLPLAYGHTM